MTTSLSLQFALLLAFAGLVFLAGLSDLRRWLVPNRYCFAIAVLFPVYALAGGADLAHGLVAGAILLAAGIVMFVRGWMGGGDVKLLAAVGLWAGTTQLLPLVIVVSLAGGVMSVIEWIGIGGARRFAGRFVPAFVTPGEQRSDGAVVPYAVAILAGGLYVFASEFLILVRNGGMIR